MARLPVSPSEVVVRDGGKIQVLLIFAFGQPATCALRWRTYTPFEGLPLAGETGLPMLADRAQHACSYRRPAMYATAQTIIGFLRIVRIGHSGQLIRWRSASDIGFASISSLVPFPGFHCHQESAHATHYSFCRQSAARQPAA